MSIPRSPARAGRVGLVAGGQTLRNLGPVIRHIIVGMLDEPRPLALICPELADTAGLPAPPLQVHRYRPPALAFLAERRARPLSEALSQSGIGLLHALDVDALPLTQVLSQQAHLPYVAAVHSLPRDFRLDDRCRAVLAASQPLRQALLDRPYVPAERIHLLRPGVYPAKMATCFTNPQHAVAIVAAGALRHYSPWATALEAFARIRASRQDCAFFVVGNGKAERPLRHQAQKLNLLLDLTFVDQQCPEGLMDILKAADLFIAPDVPDRVDVDLLSAMASGTPVLSAGAGLCDFVTDQTAVMFPPGDAAELARRIAGLLDDRAAARGLAENALDYLRANHSPARMVSQLAELYTSLTVSGANA